MEDYGRLLALPTVECVDGQVILTLVIIPTQPTEELQALGLYDELRYVADIAQMRELCSRYDIAPDALERLLPREGRHG